MFSFNSLNSCRFIGNVGKDPEAKTFGEGDKKHEVVNFSVAVRIYNPKDPKKPNTLWVNAAAHSERDVKLVKEWVKKGTLVEVEGELNVRTYESNGKSGVSTDLRLNSVVVLGGKKDGETASSPASAPAASAPATTPVDPDDDIPF